MGIFDNLSLDQLIRLLSLSRWGLLLFGLFAASACVFNQYISEKIAVVQKADKAEAIRKQRETEQTLIDARADAAAAKKIAAGLEAMPLGKADDFEDIGSFIRFYID